MENIKEDLFGNKFNPYTQKFYKKEDLFRAGVSTSDSDFIAGLKLSTQEIYDNAEKERKEELERESYRKSYQLELLEKEDRVARIKKIKAKSLALSQEISKLSPTLKSLEQQKESLFDSIGGYELYFSNLTNTDSLIINLLSDLDKTKHELKAKVDEEFLINEDIFNRDNDFYQNNYKELGNVHKDELDYKNLVSIASLHQWEINVAQKNIKNLKVEVSYLDVINNTYLSLVTKLKELSTNPETIDKEINYFITLFKETRIKEEQDNALIEKEKNEKNAIIFKKEQERKEKEIAFKKTKKKIILIGLIFGTLLSYNLISPLKYAVNNTILLGSPKYITSPGISEILSGDNFYKKTFSDLSGDNLLKKKSAVYTNKFNDIVANLKDIIPESQVRKMLSSCENGSLDCSEGIPLKTLVELSEQNNSLNKLTSKINSLIGQSIGIGLNPHYVFKVNPKGRYYMEKSTFD